MLGTDGETSRLSLLLQGLGIVIVIAAISLMAALATSDGCKGDGTFDPESPEASPSAYCKLTHFPGWPDTAGAEVILGLLFLVPAALVTAGAGVAIATRRRQALYWATAVALAWAVLTVILVIFAYTGYEAYV